MKTNWKYKFLLLAFFSLVSRVYFSQTEDFLESFHASEINQKVFLSWTIRTGNTCLGIGVLRSTDNVNFTSIGSVPGFCGSFTEPKHYDFTDNDPLFNAINYYKLDLGGEGFSQTISIELLKISDKGYVITPHPVENVSKIHFKNDSGLLTSINVYSSLGTLIYTETTNLDYFEVKIDDLEIGEYLFSLSSEVETELIIGKFIVIH